MKNLSNHPFIRRQVRVDETEPHVRDMMFRSPGSCVLATVTEVEDPEKRGRVKVVFEHLDPDQGLNPEGEVAYESNWLNVSPPFEGIQPDSLIGEQVLVQLKDSDYNTGYLSEVVSLQEPTNKVLRLPVYNKGELPDASANNLGLMAIEKDNPPGCHSLVCVVKKNGKYIWAGSSHSIMETTPLNTEAKALVQRAASQNSIFSSAADSVKSGEAFSSIKNKKERAILTAISNVALAIVESPITSALEPLEQVDSGFLENSFSRFIENIPDVTSVADGVENFAEKTGSSPRSIPSALNSVRSLLGGSLKGVNNITQDVSQYLGGSIIQSAIQEAERFGNQVQEVFPRISKTLPRLLGVAAQRVVGGGSPVLNLVQEVRREVEEFASSLEEEFAESLQALENLTDEAAALLPENIGSVVDPSLLLSLAQGAENQLATEYNLSLDDLNILTLRSVNAADSQPETLISGVVDNETNTVLIDNWFRLQPGDLRSSFQVVQQQTDYILTIEGGGNSGFFPSLGFQLIDEEQDIWQFQG